LPVSLLVSVVSQWDTFFHSLPSNSGFVLEHIENSQPSAVEGNVFPSDEPAVNPVITSFLDTRQFLIPKEIGDRNGRYSEDFSRFIGSK